MARRTKPTRTYRSAARMSPEAQVAFRALGRRVRALREAAALSQEAAAERAEITTHQWQLIEYGTTNPTLATLVAVARALGVGVGELFGEE